MTNKDRATAEAVNTKELHSAQHSVHSASGHAEGSTHAGDRALTCEDFRPRVALAS